MKMRFAAALLPALILSACGGGGGDSGGGSTPAPAAATTTVSGVASKGPLIGAKVSVYTLVNGQQGAQVGPTDIKTKADGSYTIDVSALTPSQWYLVVIESVAGTQMKDEVDQPGVAQDAPLGLKLRSLFQAPAGSATVTAQATPFTEMLVAAAANASGGLTTGNIAQAKATYQSFLAFDPLSTKPVAIDASGSSAAEQAQAALLTAVSTLANQGTLPCAAATVAGKTACAVNALSAAAAHAPSSNSFDLGAPLKAALKAATDTVVASYPSVATAVNTARGNLGCEGAACNGPTANPSTAQVAFEKLLSDLKANAKALFGGDGTVGAVPMAAEFGSLRVPADVLVKDVGAVLSGAQFYGDYRIDQSVASPVLHVGANLLPNGVGSPITCVFYQANALQLPTSPANAARLFCFASYRNVVTFDPATSEWVVKDWRHLFQLTPTVGGGFSYTAWNQLRTVRNSVSAESCPEESATCHPATQFLELAGNAPVSYTGTLSLTVDGNGDVTGGHLAGQLPPAIEPETGEVRLADGSFNADLTLTTTGNAAAPRIELAGGIDTVQAGAVAGSLSLGAPSVIDLAQGTFNFTAGWTAGLAQFEGVFKGEAPVLPIHSNLPLPTKLTLQGSLRAKPNANAALADLVTGTFTATVTGLQGYDLSARPSSSNKYSGQVSFAGTATAPGAPKLDVSASYSWVNDSPDTTPQSAGLTYKTYASAAATTPSNSITINSPLQANGDWSTIEFSESASGLSFTRSRSVSKTPLLLNGVEAGQIDWGAARLNFTNGNFISLDAFGL